jgi:hypothetical protein
MQWSVSTMSRVALTNSEIEELFSRLTDVFNYVNELRSKSPIAEKIQMPKIPPMLSESIALRLVQKGILGRTVSSVRFGGRQSDLVASTESARRIKIEVKATGKQGFQFLSEKDISADYLLWIDFGSALLTGKTTFEVYVVRAPSRYFNRPTKTTLSKLKNVVRGLNVVKLDLSKI